MPCRRRRPRMRRASRSSARACPPSCWRRTRPADWIQSAPFPARTDASKAPRLLDLLGAQAKTTYPATDLGRFDLDQPFARMTIDDQVFAFGTVNAITNEQYVLTGDTVYLVSPVHGFALPTQIDSLASHLLLADDEVPTAFVLPGATIELRDGKWVRTPPPADPCEALPGRLRALGGAVALRFEPRHARSGEELPPGTRCASRSRTDARSNFGSSREHPSCACCARTRISSTCSPPRPAPACSRPAPKRSSACRNCRRSKPLGARSSRRSSGDASSA